MKTLETLETLEKIVKYLLIFIIGIFLGIFISICVVSKDEANKKFEEKVIINHNDTIIFIKPMQDLYNGITLKAINDSILVVKQYELKIKK